ncbi:NtaA/DmoA family FMN-dependent monooxygenase [Roseibium sediminicola]|uniref:NtaA/DmoA family FMN-dependent monooxygenase n=1 Tax=Roseibium sediminicola TaxID=2933272 RepID=A0ABT0H0V6_9HYPH|nr:NtaA/DmoA family FMN-dependent monooxygenase [Roseibium sp. CAU 1639]MCK7615318.1 NtaA/DmoA family FMN-dependent monooxygenase [Roseibium sp. CAU 1639]
MSSTIAKRHMFLAGYILVPGSHFAGMWRHPYSETDFCDPDLFKDTAVTLERGGFDLAFIPESLSVTTGLSNDYETFLKRGAVGAIRHDPSQLVSLMASVTQSLGFTVTLSTTYMEPYHLARTLSTLDHFSRGRISWNVVTSAGPSNGHNFGHFPKLTSPESYDRAEEILEICRSLWQSWQDGALVADKAAGIYADIGKIRPIDHEGDLFQLRGPLSLPAGPDGEPILMSVGVSPRGRDFSAKWVDVIFAIQADADGMSELRADVRRRAAEKGRDPEKIFLLTAVQPVVGETEAIARARADYLDELICPDVAIAFLSGMIGRDATGFDPETPIDEVLEKTAGASGKGAVDGGAAFPWLDRIRAEDRARNWTLRDIAIRMSRSTSTPRLVGTPEQVADQLEAYFLAEACDGFVITPTHFPGSFDEFSRSVVPILRARGHLREAAQEPLTLRQRLGLQC